MATEFEKDTIRRIGMQAAYDVAGDVEPTGAELINLRRHAREKARKRATAACQDAAWMGREFNGNFPDDGYTSPRRFGDDDDEGDDAA